jgi:hypothetical protein
VIVAFGAVAALFIARRRRTATVPQSQGAAVPAPSELAFETA